MDKTVIEYEAKYNRIAEINDNEGILLTTHTSFISPVYLKIVADYKKEKEEWENYIKSDIFPNIVKTKKTVTKYSGGWSSRMFEHPLEEYNDVVEVDILDGNEVIIRDFPTKEEWENSIIKHFKNQYTKEIKVKDPFGEWIFDSLRIGNNDNTLSNFSSKEVMEFPEFEDYLIKFYNLEGYDLVLPPESEDSPLHFLDEEPIIKDNRYYFIKG
jgi:hypothetical protein